jgi:hypothetical protein
METKIMNKDRKDNMIEVIKNRKDTAYYREGSFITEIILGKTKYIFPYSKMNKGMWIFRSVILSAQKYVNVNIIDKKPYYPVNFNNVFFNQSYYDITATDINHAYWRIAYLMGVISKKLYDKGLLIEDKGLRLASLSNLSSKKEYQIIKNGEITEEYKTLRYNEVLHTVYNNIRYTCYEHMTNIANLLGEDFICYKTDCIYYTDSLKNREIVHNYLTLNNLLFKQLIEDEE